MDFDFSPQQYEFQETMRSFLDEKYDLARVNALLTGDGFDSALWSKLTELGAFAMMVPEEYGGLGLSFVDLALVLEEFGRALVPAPVVETICAGDVIACYGTDDQKSRILPLLAEGKLRIVPAINEVEAGFDPDELGTMAVATGDGWKLTGRKILAPQAASADIILAAVRFGAEGPLGLVLLEPGRHGVAIREHSTIDPSSRFHEVTFESVSLTESDILSCRPSRDALLRLLDANGAAAALVMTGIASKVLDRSVHYAAQRVQFDKPIGSFQAIKHRCADMAVAIDGSRSAAYYAAWALAEDAPERAKAVSMAKSFCGDTSRFVCNEGIQIHGGIGFTWELGLHFYLRRAKVLEYSYGDASYHRERVLTAALAELAQAQ